MKKALKVIGAILSGVVVLFGASAFITGNASFYPFGVAFMVIGAVPMYFCLRRSPEDKARAEVRRAAKAQRRQTMAEEARLDEQRRQEEKERQRQAQRQAQQEEKEHSHQARQQQYSANAGRQSYETSAGVPTCPRCGSTSVSGAKRGYKVVGGIFWMLALGVGGYLLFYEYWDRIAASSIRVFGDDARRLLAPISRQIAAAFFATLGALFGLNIGGTGSQRVTVTCLNCGCQYDPALRHLYEAVTKNRNNTQGTAAPQSGPNARSEWGDPPIPPGFVEYLRETGQDDPRYSGRNNALECVLIDMADDKERAVMWAYAVDCTLSNCTMGNILHAPGYDRYRAFGEYASRHGDVLHSISDRRAYEYWNPTKTTKAYMAAADFLRR